MTCGERVSVLTKRVEFRKREERQPTAYGTDVVRQSYITEATSGLTKYAFDVLKALRVELHCDPDNWRSTAVARRLGFSLSQHLKGNTTRPNSTMLRDTQVFVRTNAIGLPDVEATWPKS